MTCSQLTPSTPKTSTPSAPGDSRPPPTPSPATTTPTASGSSRWSAPRRRSRRSGPRSSSSPPTPPTSSVARTAWRSRAATSGARFPTKRWGRGTTKIARLPVSGGWHALVYTKTAEYGFEKDSFLLLAQSEEEAPAQHHRFLDKRSPLPLHGSWAGWLWDRGLDNGEIVPLQSVGVSRLQVLPQGRQAPGRPLRRRGVGLAHPAH